MHGLSDNLSEYKLKYDETVKTEHSLFKNGIKDAHGGYIYPEVTISHNDLICSAVYNPDESKR